MPSVRTCLDAHCGMPAKSGFNSFNILEIPLHKGKARSDRLGCRKMFSEATSNQNCQRESSHELKEVYEELIFQPLKLLQ